MKTNAWLILGMLVATAAMAQSNAPETTTPMPLPTPTNTEEVAVPSPSAANAPALMPADTATSAPAATPAKKKTNNTHRKRRAAAVRRPPFHETPVTLVAGPAEVAASRLNVRARPSFKGVVVTQLTHGDQVTVLEQINLKHHPASEPAQWAKIAYPAKAHAWVFSRFINHANKTVRARRLNVRAGPGENYGSIGLLHRGDPVNEITTKGHWMEIEPPAGTYAFVAAVYLKQEAPAVVAASPAPQPAPTPTSVPETAPIVSTPSQPTTPSAPPAAQPQPPVEQPLPSALAQAPPPRIVSHEGVVRHVGSLIAPTAYELYDPATGDNIDYLYTTSTNLDLSRYANTRIIVTGEEGLDARWKNTPVISIQRIQVIATNAVPRRVYYSPRQSEDH